MCKKSTREVSLVIYANIKTNLGEADSRWSPVFGQICWSTGVNWARVGGLFWAPYDHLYAVFGQICWSTGVDWARGGGGAPDLGFRPSADGGERGPRPGSRESGGRATGPAPFRSFFRRKCKKFQEEI